MAVSDQELIALFNEHTTEQIYVVRFTDGTTDELWECQIDAEHRECIATIVRPCAGSPRLAGQAISFSFDDVTEVQLSERGFDYYR